MPILLLAADPVTTPPSLPAEGAVDGTTETVAETARAVPGAFESLVANVVDLFLAVWHIVLDVGAIVLPWLPLVAWVLFWMFAVNWVRLRRVVLVEGGWIGILLLGGVAVLVWATIAPPIDGHHELLGMHVSNYVGKTIYVTTLIVIAFLCGSVQLAGTGETVARFEAEDATLRTGSDH